jgi:hypothetical protein
MYTMQFNSDRPGEDTNFVVLSNYMHQAEITGLDVCIRKPLIATCSMDQTICIWNYVERSLEVF